MRNTNYVICPSMSPCAVINPLLLTRSAEHCTWPTGSQWSDIDEHYSTGQTGGFHIWTRHPWSSWQWSIGEPWRVVISGALLNIALGQQVLSDLTLIGVIPLVKLVYHSRTRHPWSSWQRSLGEPWRVVISGTLLGGIGSSCSWRHLTLWHDLCLWSTQTINLSLQSGEVLPLRQWQFRFSHLFMIITARLQCGGRL